MIISKDYWILIFHNWQSFPRFLEDASKVLGLLVVEYSPEPSDFGYHFKWIIEGEEEAVEWFDVLLALYCDNGNKSL